MLKRITLAVALACASQAYAATEFSNFTPLTSSAGPTATPATPITLGNPNWTQETIADAATQLGVANPSASRAPDMISSDASGRYLFMPFEQGYGGVQRIDLQDPNYATRTVEIVSTAQGQAQNWQRGDASRFTPWGSMITGEESWGTGSSNGRMFEVTNALTATAGTGNLVARSVIPHAAHEGLVFDSANSLYFIDEYSGGALYKYVSNNANATNGDDYFASGQTFVASVNGGNNANATGAITWEAITDVNGAALAGKSVLAADGITIDGRASADAVNATNYNRPEDMELQLASNGHELLYMATTGTHEVYTTDLTTGTISLFADRNTIDLATGLAVGSQFTSPDNLAIDADGTIYIVEDEPGGVSDDIWRAVDLNHDGDLLDAGEGLQRWVSNGTPGSEFTGLYFDKNNANVAYVNIQHPGDNIDRTIMITAAVPEPETYAMLLAGLGLMGFAARRNNKK
jgi:uncharacterized protein